MATWGNVDFTELMQLQQKLEALKSPEQQKLFYNGCAKEVAARFLGKVIRKTPVGKNTTAEVKTGEVYKRGAKKGQEKTKTMVVKQGGTLRRGWTANTEAQAESGNVKDATMYVQSLSVDQNGKTYTITITNPVHYASYVENGHRQTPGRFVPAIGKRLKRNWVEGQFFMAKSEQEVKAEIPSVLQRRLNNYLQSGGNQ